MDGAHRANRWLRTLQEVLSRMLSSCHLPREGRGSTRKPCFPELGLRAEVERARQGPVFVGGISRGKVSRVWGGGSLYPLLISTFLLLSHGHRPTGGELAPVAVDGGGVVRLGGLLVCTCATLAILRTTRRCGPPGAWPLGRPPVGPFVGYIPLHPAFSPASRVPNRTSVGGSRARTTC